MSRLLMFKNLQRQDSEISAELVRTEDAQALGLLMFESYQGTIDYDGETLEQSIQEMQETLNGKYGKLLNENSYVIYENGLAVSAVIFVFFSKENMPLLAFNMTHPTFKGRGLSQKLIAKGLNSLIDSGYQNACLVVTEGNQPAQMIYEKLGFRTRS